MRALKATVLIALVVLENGCGLPSPYYLSPPTVSQVFSPTLAPSVCTIQNANRTQDYQATFVGFELYYKIFGSTSDSTFLADQQYASINYSPTDLVNSHGFRRVTLGPGTTGLVPDSTPGSASVPLININAIDPADLSLTFSITIHINESTAIPGDPNPVPLSFYTYTPASGPYAGTPIYQEIRRFVPVDPSLIAAPPAGLGQTCKPFASNSAGPTVYGLDYISTDADIGSPVFTSSQNNGGQVVVMMYAASYGLAGSQVVYSIPAYLGYTQLSANMTK